MVKCIEYATGDAHVHYGDNSLLLLNKDILTVVRDKGLAEVMSQKPRSHEAVCVCVGGGGGGFNS